MKTLAQISAGFLAVSVALALALPAAAIAKEEKVKLEDCPAAVQKTIKEKAGDGKIIEVDKETTKDGKVVYEAEVRKANGKKVDIRVAEDGKLIKVEDDDEDDD